MRRTTAVVLAAAAATSGVLLGLGLAGSKVCGLEIHQEVGGPTTSRSFCRHEPQWGMAFAAALPPLLAVLAWRHRGLALLTGAVLVLHIGQIPPPEMRWMESVAIVALILATQARLRRRLAARWAARPSPA